jgi:hypothetical protein
VALGWAVLEANDSSGGGGFATRGFVSGSAGTESSGAHAERLS